MFKIGTTGNGRSTIMVDLEKALNGIYTGEHIRRMIEDRIVAKIADEWIKEHGKDLEEVLKPAAALAMASMARALTQLVEKYYDPKSQDS